MKHTTLCAVGSLFIANTFASGEFIGFQLVEWAVDGLGTVPDSTTWQLFASFNDPNDQLTSVGGSPASAGAIQSNTGFYQNPFGGPASTSINYIFGMFPSLHFDSWVTIGYEDLNGNPLTHTGIDFSNFEAGGDLFIPDGSWSLPQNDPAAFGIELDGFDNFHVLVGQFTTYGHGPESAPWGQLNLSGTTGMGTAWSSDGALFGTPIPAPATAFVLGIAMCAVHRRRKPH